MTTAEIESLLERVRKATGPDRELDAAIAAIVGGWHRGSFDWYDHVGKRRNQSPTFTTSIDACLALIERVLPGWMRASGNCGEENMPWACLTEPVEPCRDFAADAPAETLALLGALLLALLHQASDKGMIDAE